MPVAASKWISHPNLDCKTFHNDFAIIRLLWHFRFSSSLTPVCLPSPGQNYDQREVVTAGWGTLYSAGPQPNILPKVGLSTITNAKYKAPETYYSSAQITSTMICAREMGKDSCQGDSGGPLITLDRVLVGVVSWGYACAWSRAPGVYARVTSQLEWIKGQIQGVTCRK
jgi:trypsin